MAQRYRHYSVNYLFINKQIVVWLDQKLIAKIYVVV